MDQTQPIILGLPDDYDLTIDEARALRIDDLIAGASFEHGLFEASSAIVRARDLAATSDDARTANILQLLVVVFGMAPADDARAPFSRFMTGTDSDGNLWRTPLPRDLTEKHVESLGSILNVTATGLVRAHLSDILWYRSYPRNPEHARLAVREYLSGCAQTFSPDEWVRSEQYFARAARIALQLGSQRPEYASVIAAAWSMLEKLQDSDPLYYTERIIVRIMNTLSAESATMLLERVKEIAAQCGAVHDYDRARVYFELAADLARCAQAANEIRDLQLASAETHVTQALHASRELERSLHLRMARQALLNAGASRGRIAEVAAILDESQRLAVHEMTSIETKIDPGLLPELVRGLIRDADPIKAIWIIAGVPVLPSKSHARKTAEESVEKYAFAFGFGRRHLSRDGRQEGQTPGSIGSSDEQRKAVVAGVMRDDAARSRIYSVIAAIEPGRHQMMLKHQYSLSELYSEFRSRPLIPQKHGLLWAKGIYAGFCGEFDVAVHLLAPQLENALREVLRRQGEIVYTTDDGVQNLISFEKVLTHPRFPIIFGEDLTFALETSLAERLGANLRNGVAHGIIDDATANSYDSAFVWWLALRLLRFYGPDPLADKPKAAE